MRINDLREAMLEAERFLKKSKAMMRVDEEKSSWCGGCKESAACLRSSMDLSRALSKLRSNKG